MTLFKKVCPRCGRRYPKNFNDCLECGTPLIDTEKEARDNRIRKYLPFLAALLAGILILDLHTVGQRVDHPGRRWLVAVTPDGQRCAVGLMGS